MAVRIHNFNPGPAALPLTVLEQTREAMEDFAGSGMSISEISHRSPFFEKGYNRGYVPELSGSVYESGLLSL